MGGLIAAALVAAFLAWMFGFGRDRHQPAPEDDVTTPIDLDELEEAEREVRDDRSIRSISDAMRDSAGAVDQAAEDDDWGPGTGRSNLPGII